MSDADDLKAWILKKLRAEPWYEPPTDDRSETTEIHGLMHVLCYNRQDYNRLLPDITRIQLTNKAQAKTIEEQRIEIKCTIAVLEHVAEFGHPIGFDCQVPDLAERVAQDIADICEERDVATKRIAELEKEAVLQSERKIKLKSHLDKAHDRRAELEDMIENRCDELRSLRGVLGKLAKPTLVERLFRIPDWRARMASKALALPTDSVKTTERGG